MTIMSTDREQLHAFYDACVANLEKSYDLVYVDYRDSLTDEQVDHLFTGDYESLWDSFEPWEGDARWEGTKYALEEVVTYTRTQWERLDDRDYTEVADDFENSNLYERLREDIEERDSSDFVRDLARYTPGTLCRAIVIDEDDSWSFRADLTVTEVCRDLGIKRNRHNYRVVRDALHECAPEYSVLMGMIVFTVDPGDMYRELSYDTEYVDVIDPHIWFGNPFAGSGYCTDEPVRGTFRIPRSEFHTDKAAFGYGWDEVAGVYASAYEAIVRPVPNESKED